MKLMEGKISNQTHESQLMKKMNDAEVDNFPAKFLDPEKKIEEKEVEYNELEVFCKETVLFYQKRNESLKKKICRIEKLIKEKK